MAARTLVHSEELGSGRKGLGVQQLASILHVHTHTKKIVRLPVQATTMISCRFSVRYPKSRHVIIKRVPTLQTISCKSTAWV